MDFLILTSGPHRGQILELPEYSERPIRIGREDADICLDDDHVSRMHAQLHVCPGGWRVSDIGSSNGTFVNDTRIDRPCRLKDGDRLDVGKTALIFGRLDDERLADLEDFDPSGEHSTADRLLMAQIIRRIYLQRESEAVTSSASPLDSPSDGLPLTVASPVVVEAPAGSGAQVAGVLVVIAILIGLNMFLVARAGTESQRLTELMQSTEENPRLTADALLPKVEQIVTNHQDPAVKAIADQTQALANQSTAHQTRFETLLDTVLSAVQAGPGPREVERLDRIHAAVTAGPDPREQKRLAEIHAAVTGGPDPKQAQRLADIHAAVTAPPDPVARRLLEEIRAGVLTQTESEAGLRHRLAEFDTRLQKLAERDPQPILEQILAAARSSSRGRGDAESVSRLLKEIQVSLAAHQPKNAVALGQTMQMLEQILTELRSVREEAAAALEATKSKAESEPVQTVQVLHQARDRVVFLVDASESVAEVFPLVLDELDHLLATLQVGQEFNVLFCRGAEAIEAPGRGLKVAGPDAREQIMQWARAGMNGRVPRGRFNPAQALRLAMEDRPERIWLLSNTFGGAGQPVERRRLVRLFELAHGQSGIPVDAIQLFVQDPHDTLRQISQRSGGTFTFLLDSNHQRANPSRN